MDQARDVDCALTPYEQTCRELCEIMQWFTITQNWNAVDDKSDYVGEGCVKLDPKHWEGGVDPNDARIVRATADLDNLVREEMIRLAREQIAIDEKEAAEYLEEQKAITE